MDTLNKPTITVIGCGYVGLTTAALLANCGLCVYALEINPARLAAIKCGKSFFYEDGIEPLLRTGLESGNLIATDDYSQAVPCSDIVISCVGTPDYPDGSANLSYVFDAASQAFSHMKTDSIYVQKSTVPVGTGLQIESLVAESGKSISYVSNPEFLRESTAVRDTLWFDRVVVGGRDKIATTAVLDLYRSTEAYRATIARLTGLTLPPLPATSLYIETSLASAELIKVSANAFLALKISFANSIAKLSDQAGADITEVMEAVGADRRIGRAFLTAGRGYGGGCFPKDVSSLIRSAETYGVTMDIMLAAAEVNQSMPEYIIKRAETAFDKLSLKRADAVFNQDGISRAEAVTKTATSPLKNQKVAVLGVAFKSGTSDVRRSPGIVIANMLVARGADVRIYDPQALEEAKPHLSVGIAVHDTLKAAIQGTGCIFVATDWPEFLELGLKQLALLSGTQLIVDCLNCIDYNTELPNTVYVGVGRH